MRISDRINLCYSLNVYPALGKKSDRISLIREKIPRIRSLLFLNKTDPFAIGLWLNAGDASRLLESGELNEFRKLLEKENLYVFTVNAFPYGTFHGERVKERVYTPDWTTDERRDYTCMVADIIAGLLPEDMVGSISTVPGTYKSFIRNERQIEQIVRNLLYTAGHLAKLNKEKGKKIILGIEPEPDCLWESPDEFIDFHQKYLVNDNHREYLGICYDTCHQELLEGLSGEGLIKFVKNNIPVAKIHLSAALFASADCDKKELAPFADDVYLHQTRVIDENGGRMTYADLSEALEKADKTLSWITHFHVPVFCSELYGGLKAVKGELEAVLNIVKNNPEICGNLEIETYTYSVLPPEMRGYTLEQSIAAEYKWVMNRLK